MAQQRSGHPILRAGLLYGLIGGAISLLGTVLSVTGVDKAAGGLSRVYSVAFFVAALGLYLLAGRSVATKTGSVGSASLAGLLTGLIAGAIGAALTIATFYIAPDMVRSAVARSNTRGIEITDTLILIALIVGAVLGFLFALGLGAGLGAIGGLIGRGKYQAPLYQEAMYTGLPNQGLPPPPPQA
jgi:hypothetical protein